MAELLNDPRALSALIGALAATTVTLLIGGVKGIYQLYEVRRGAQFARELELEVEGYVEVAPREPQGEAANRLLHVRMQAHNAGGSRLGIEAATLKVSPRLIEEGRSSRSRELTFGEPDVYEAFPGRVPGLSLIPGQDHPRRAAMEVPANWSLPLKVRLEVRSGDDRWWIENVAGTAPRVDNEGR